MQDGPLVAVGHDRPAQHGGLVAHGVAHLEQLGVRVHVQVFGQATEEVGRVGRARGAAVERALRAEPGSAVAAVPAVTAAPGALEDHPVALGHSVDRGGSPTQAFDLAEDLVAQDHRVGHVDAAPEVLDVGATHSTHADPQEGSVVGHVGHGVLPDLQALGSQQRRGSNSAHGSPPVAAQTTHPASGW